MIRPWEAPPTGPAAVQAERFAALVPVIATERLRLRAPRIDDFPIYARFLIDADPAAADDEAREEAWLDFCQIVASWPLRGFGSWTADDKQGHAVGAVVLNHEFGDPEVELGWAVAEGVEGQGIAIEATRAARAHLFGAMGFATLVSYIDPVNTRSIAVAERLGAVRDAKAEAVLNDEILVYRHSPETVR
ncbi:MAG: GNAT family N-acetyltransferase [Tabrizicola sp.]|jgi:RimJ/RimL family protein N-acetyltransferase|nr:GNAT family N-acetyltransferase [Tabrizicola sp.]